MRPAPARRRRPPAPRPGRGWATPPPRWSPARRGGSEAARSNDARGSENARAPCRGTSSTAARNSSPPQRARTVSVRALLAARSVAATADEATSGHRPRRMPAELVVDLLEVIHVEDSDRSPRPPRALHSTRARRLEARALGGKPPVGRMPVSAASTTSWRSRSMGEQVPLGGDRRATITRKPSPSRAARSAPTSDEGPRRSRGESARRRSLR